MDDSPSECIGQDKQLSPEQSTASCVQDGNKVNSNNLGFLKLDAVYDTEVSDFEATLFNSHELQETNESVDKMKESLNEDDDGSVYQDFIKTRETNTCYQADVDTVPINVNQYNQNIDNDFVKNTNRRKESANHILSSHECKETGDLNHDYRRQTSDFVENTHCTQRYGFLDLDISCCDYNNAEDFENIIVSALKQQILSKHLLSDETVTYAGTDKDGSSSSIDTCTVMFNNEERSVSMEECLMKHEAQITVGQDETKNCSVVIPTNQTYMHYESKPISKSNDGSMMHSSELIVDKKNETIMNHHSVRLDKDCPKEVKFIEKCFLPSVTSTDMHACLNPNKTVGNTESNYNLVQSTDDAAVRKEVDDSSEVHGNVTCSDQILHNNNQEHFILSNYEDTKLSCTENEECVELDVTSSIKKSKIFSEKSEEKPYETNNTMSSLNSDTWKSNNEPKDALIEEEIFLKKGDIGVEGIYTNQDTGSLEEEQTLNKDKQWLVTRLPGLSNSSGLNVFRLKSGCYRFERKVQNSISESEQSLRNTEDSKASNLLINNNRKQLDIGSKLHKQYKTDDLMKEMDLNKVKSFDRIVSVMDTVDMNEDSYKPSCQLSPTGNYKEINESQSQTVKQMHSAFKDKSDRGLKEEKAQTKDVFTKVTFKDVPQRKTEVHGKFVYDEVKQTNSIKNQIDVESYKTEAHSRMKISKQLECNKEFDSSLNIAVERRHHNNNHSTDRTCTNKGKDTTDVLMNTYFKRQKYMQLRKKHQSSITGKRKCENDISEDQMNVKKRKINQTTKRTESFQEKQSIQGISESENYWQSIKQQTQETMFKKESSKIGVNARRRKQTYILSQRKQRFQKSKLQRALDKQKDAYRKKVALSKEMPDEAAERRHRNKLSQERHRSRKTLQQKAREKQTDILRKKEAFNKETPEEVTDRKLRNKLSQEGHRKQKTPQQKAREKQTDILRKKEALNKETPMEATERKLRHKLSQEGHRKQKTPQQKAREKQTDILRKKEALNKETPMEATERKLRHKLSQEGHRKQKTPQQKAREKQTDILRKKEALNKETPMEATERKLRHKLSQEGHRKQKTPQQKAREKQIDILRKKEALNKETPEKATDRKLRNKLSQEGHRKQKTPQLKSKDKTKDLERKEQQRQLPHTVEMAIKLFKAVIQEGPTYICTSCNRLLFRGTVTRFSEDEFKDDQKVFVNKCRTLKLSHDDLEYICHTCRNALRKGSMPSIAVANCLKLDEIPLPLKDLSSLEVVFISRRIPFMKLLGLPRGKQKAIHGCVVNIPVEPEQTLSVLPRAPTPDSVVAVKLKRKLQYRGHVVMQNIQPYKIKQALQLLKHGLQNPFYKDVLIDENWEDTNERQHPELWASLTADTGTDQDNAEAEAPDEAEDELQKQEDHDEAEEDEDRTGLSGLPYDSCLQPKAAMEKSDVLLNIAPGEGKRPQPFEADEHAEELSFPHLFPTGKFGFSMNRETKLSLKKYFQARILNCDGRFSKSIEYIFYAQYRSEAKEVADNLSIALRKGKQVDVTAGDLKQKVSSFIHNELGIHFLQNIRGSPAFYNKMLYDLLGMIRQLGACTWFLTLSAADLKWTDTIRIIAQQQGIILTEEAIANLSWEERCHWLRTNPVTAARHFDDRVQKFMKHILLNKNLNPLGKIIDYKYRIEFQQRGSPHLHMLAWCKDAPSFDTNTEEEIAQYVDQHVACSLPKDDDSLKDLLLLVQKHTHSGSCRKHGKACRFHFPHLPVKTTTVFKPPEEDVPTAKQEYYKEILANVHEELDKLDGDSEVTIDTLLDRVNIDEESYMEALKWFKTKKGQPAIMLKRETSEIFINNYNQVLMKAWEANLDVQFVTSVLTCVFYVASYVSKPEKTLGDLLKAVSKSGQHLGAKASMKSVAKKFLSHREVCAQEAVYRLLSLPLTQGSRQVLFIPTDLPENRTRLFKPMKVLKQLEDDDPDVFQTNILDRYAARPNRLEGMCLAAFAANYGYKTSARNKDNLQGDNSSQDDSDDEVAEDNLPKQIVLKRDLGHMVKRKTEAIIRSHQFSVHQDPEKYYHSQLLLYLPWRDEASDLLQTSYKTCYTDNTVVIRENKSRFEHHAEDVAVAMDNLEEFGVPEDSWGDIAAQNEQARGDEREEGNHQDERSLYNALDVSEDQQVRGDLGLIPHSYELQTEKMTSQEYNDLVLTLNDLQSDVHSYILDWCTKMVLTHQIEKPPAFHIFLTGGAGVGKSHLVRAIVQTATRMFTRNNQIDSRHVLVCAPTGTAAYNVSGYTIHSALLIPIEETKFDDYIPLSNEKLASLKESLGDVKILIIDEISMVGCDMLLTIHRRLCDIMGNEEPFGGISVLAVGDLLQLPPVGQFPVFDQCLTHHQMSLQQYMALCGLPILKL